jgi:hypothetical protein
MVLSNVINGGITDYYTASMFDNVGCSKSPFHVIPCGGRGDVCAAVAFALASSYRSGATNADIVCITGYISEEIHKMINIELCNHGFLFEDCKNLPISVLTPIAWHDIRSVCDDNTGLEYLIERQLTYQKWLQGDQSELHMFEKCERSMTYIVEAHQKFIDRTQNMVVEDTKILNSLLEKDPIKHLDGLYKLQ